MVTLGQVGLGYCGPNLPRNLSGLAQARVKVSCDVDEAALKRMAAQYPGLRATNDYGELLHDPAVESTVVIAPTPLLYDFVTATATRSTCALAIPTPRSSIGVSRYAGSASTSSPASSTARPCSAMAATACRNGGCWRLGSGRWSGVGSR